MRVYWHAKTKEGNRGPATEKHIEELHHLTMGRLRARYREVFDEASRSNHEAFLFRRIAWRLQALAEGDFSERARQRALEIAHDADLRIRVPRGQQAPLRCRWPARLAGIGGCRSRGTVLSRHYCGQVFVVKVLDSGFEYSGRRYRSLSAIAREITGTRWNGFAFFRLRRAPEARCA